MRNKFRLKNKLVSMALALLLAAQLLASFPMNVFAGTGSHGMPTAPRIKTEKVSVTSAFVCTVNANSTGMWKRFTSTGTSSFNTDVYPVNFTGVCIVPAPVTVDAPVVATFYGTLTGEMPKDHATFTCPITFDKPVAPSVEFNIHGSITINGPFEGLSYISVTGGISGTGTVVADLTVPVDVTAKVTDDKIDIQATASPQPV